MSEFFELLSTRPVCVCFTNYSSLSLTTYGFYFSFRTIVVFFSCVLCADLLLSFIVLEE